MATRGAKGTARGPGANLPAACGAEAEAVVPWPAYLLESDYISPGFSPKKGIQPLQPGLFPAPHITGGRDLGLRERDWVD